MAIYFSLNLHSATSHILLFLPIGSSSLLMILIMAETYQNIKVDSVPSSIILISKTLANIRLKNLLQTSQLINFQPFMRNLRNSPKRAHIPLLRQRSNLRRSRLKLLLKKQLWNFIFLLNSTNHS